VTLAGCPLEEKISEMNTVKQRGQPVGALAIVTIDNPMARHRPPHLQRLHEVLHLPEAGAGGHPAGRDAHAEGRAGAAVGLRDLRLLTRWNPLNLRRPVPPATGYKVLVVGLGPAGFTLAHHLMNDGHTWSASTG
jgi:NADPH-dependent 2,4-dienoyl-CoA reductase/sulfur reductase-like enzyme